MMRRILLLVVLSTFGGIDLIAQSIIPTSRFVINIDYARFRNDEQSGYLEIYYGFYPNLLTYQWSEGKFRAGVHLWTRLREEGTETLAVNERVLLPVEITDTTDVSLRFPFITQAGYVLPLGDYTFEVVAADSLNPSRRDSTSLVIHIDVDTGGVVCSDLELCSKIVSSSKKDDPFFKNSLEVVPNPTLIFGSTAYPVVFHYLELYNLNPQETYTVKTLITDSEGSIMKESSRTKKYGVGNAVEVGTTNMTSIVSGKFHFNLFLLNQGSEEVVRTEKVFFIYNPHLVVRQEPALTFQASVLEGLSEKELDAEFNQAQYIATNEEKTMYKKLDNEIGKREFMARFWTDVLKGRLDHPPIRRVDYLRLIEITNEGYSRMGREGWKTDRGRVYILYGKPDEVERHPQMSEYKPYEIWRYFEIEGGVEFVFIDQLGFGDYRLVHSTKRGELRDDEWERFLR